MMKILAHTAMYRSGPIQYYVYKYTSLVLGCCFLLIAIVEGIFGETDLSLVALVALVSLGAIAHFRLMCRDIVRVEVDHQTIRIVNDNRVVPWLEVSEINYQSTSNLYELVLPDQTFYFPPLDFPYSFFWKKIPDDMDNLINKKKRELSI